MQYENYFLRVQDCKNFDQSLYWRKISSVNSNVRNVNLFEDCFSNHVDYVSPNTRKLVFDNESSSRYIQRDNLSAFFINEIYEPPTITSHKTQCKIEYADFIAEFAESSFYLTPESRFALGSNRIRYVLGDVGIGKSAFIKRVLSDLESRSEAIDPNYRLVSVYIDMERKYNYGTEPMPLKDDFEIYLFNEIIDRINDLGVDFDSTELNGINPANDPRLSLKLLVSKLKDSRIRLLIYIDNLDFYHYYYARYAFFAEYNKRQERSIVDNIMWLRAEITSPDALGHLGLNIIIAARSYVYDEIMARSFGTDTEKDTTQAICLALTTEDVVIGSRLLLLSKAIEVVAKHKHGAASSLKEMLSVISVRLLGEKYSKGISAATPIKTIYKLGQHGHRSLVQFLSSLNISYLDHELVERFFSRQVSALFYLYFNNIRQRYTQEQDHFPNIFLVDCLVMEGDDFPKAHQPHMHTYWLKYLILKLIMVRNPDGVKLDQILHIFRDQAKYDNHLVRHVVGSLCTANEFRCAEIDPRHATRPFNARKIYLTERGKMLFRKIEGVELCFKFEYFGTIIDDKWLSYPKNVFRNIFHPRTSFAHLYATGDNYVKASIESIYLKAKELLYFIRVLEASYLVESQKYRPSLHAFIQEEGIAPDFEDIRAHIVGSSESRLKTFSKGRNVQRQVENIRNLSETLISDSSFEDFFRSYFQSGALITP